MLTYNILLTVLFILQEDFVPMYLHNVHHVSESYAATLRYKNNKII
jgi:hypothetical protein